jgi:hypothetical protein
LKFCAICEAGVYLALIEVFGKLVSPTPFYHEGVPDQDFFIVWLAPLIETPLKDFFIRPTLQRTFSDIGIGDLQETAAAPIESSTEIFVIIGRKRIYRHLPDFFEHPGKVNNPAHLSVGAARRRHP